MCGLFNVLLCVCLGFEMCCCVSVWDLYGVVMCICGLCNVLLCICLRFVMCGCVYVWIL